MTLPALVAELRSVVGDVDAGEARSAAARQLARLAAAGVPGADPAQWYGLAPLSSEEPLRAAGQTVDVSPSRVEAFDRCALRWLLEQAGGRAPAATALSLGNLVHELAEQVPDGDLALLRDLLARRFPRLGLGSGWVADAERERAERMIEKLADYVRRATREGRRLVAVEQPVQVQVGRAVITGMVDRLEQDEQGRLVVVDLKTGRTPPRTADLDRHAQLGTYQVAVEEGGFAEVAPAATGSGGARLVQLGNKTKGLTVQEQAPIDSDEEPRWAHRLLEAAADGMAGHTFPATVNPMCRMCSLKRSCPAQLEGRQVGQ